MKITVLCENLVGNMTGQGEHGFSVFVETEHGNYLFDTGRGSTIVGNALTFNKDLKSIAKIFLSHGHYDHTGGLPEVLKVKGEVDVHVHPLVFSDRFIVEKKDGEEKRRFVGIPYKKVYLESLGARFIMKEAFCEIEKGLYLTGEIPRRTSFEKTDQRLFVAEGGQMSPDLFPDDQSLVIDTERGLVLVLGCAHAGLINIINHVMEKTGKERFHAILGGTHLDFLTKEQLEDSIAALKKIDIEKIGACHCTGLHGAFRLRQEFKDRFFYGGVGYVLQV